MIVIVGGGYAGGATALALARRGRGREVVLLEAEPRAGEHASGRNAGLMAALLEDDPAMAAMTVRGMRLLAGSPVTTRCGSILLVPGAAAAEELLARAARLGVRAESVPATGLAREIPLLAGAPAPVGVRCPDDAKVDPLALASMYLDEAARAGVRVVTGVSVTGVSTRGKRATGVETTAGRFDADQVVNAAGAWAGRLGVMAGLGDLGLIAYRRHLFVTAPIPNVGSGWPFVWDLPREVYFRPDGDRLTLCICDEEPHPPGVPVVSAEIRARLSGRIAEAFPALSTFTIESERACLRTFAADRRYVVGPDPRLPGFFWVAGLGGSGAVAGGAIGEMAATLLLGETVARTGPDSPRDFAPARLIDSGA